MAEAFGCVVGGCVVCVVGVYVCLLQFVHHVEGGVEFVVYLCCVFVWFALGVVGWFRVGRYAEVCPAGGGRTVGDERLVFWCGGGGVVEVGLYGDSGDEFVGLFFAEWWFAFGDEDEVGSVLVVLLGCSGTADHCGK